MKIMGQSFIDPSERFFHGMYVSAAGNPVYGGTPVDGNNIQAISGLYLPSILLTFLLAAILIASYLYLSKRMTVQKQVSLLNTST